MASIASIKKEIAEIAQRRKNTTAAEIERIVNQLAGYGYSVTTRPMKKGGHGVIYSVDSRRFSVCTHNRGGKQLLCCYVNEFLNAMIDVGLYEEE
jgi:hypothetical protein